MEFEFENENGSRVRAVDLVTEAIAAHVFLRTSSYLQTDIHDV